jgi:hypothetical protein
VRVLVAAENRTMRIKIVDKRRKAFSLSVMAEHVPAICP